MLDVDGFILLSQIQICTLVTYVLGLPLRAEIYALAVDGAYSPYRCVICNVVSTLHKTLRLMRICMDIILSENESDAVGVAPTTIFAINHNRQTNHSPKRITS